MAMTDSAKAATSRPLREVRTVPVLFFEFFIFAFLVSRAVFPAAAVKVIGE
ncbi:MAG: hypothetical protein ABIQ18_11690 [Umezawaea sp.]